MHMSIVAASNTFVQAGAAVANAWTPMRRCRLHAALDFLMQGVAVTERSVRERGR